MRQNTKKNKNKICTIPNVLSLLRLLLIPWIIWCYIGKGDSTGAFILLVLCAVTDILDGMIARKFNMVSDFGKALDPVADKLTQLVMLYCLISRFPKMLGLFLLLAAKEIMTGITSLFAICASREVHSAQWHGKVATVLLYAVMMLHLLWDTIPGWLSDSLLTVCACVLLYSGVKYFIQNMYQIHSRMPAAKEQETF